MQRLLAAAEELAQLGTWGFDLQTLGTVWSEGMRRIHGVGPAIKDPGIETLLRQVHTDDRARIRAVLEQAIAEPERLPATGAAVEYRIVRPDGSVRRINLRFRIDRDSHGAPGALIGAAQDVTDRRLVEGELQAHYAVGQTLREWQSFEEGVIDLLRRLGTALDYPIGTLWTADDGSQDRIAVRAFWAAPGVDPSEIEAISRTVTLMPGIGIPGRVWVTGEPLVVEDVQAGLLPALRRIVAQIGVRSALAFPAPGDGVPLAVLSFYAFDRRLPSERLVRTLGGIGAELGRFLHTRRAELGGGRLTERELDVLRLAAEGRSGPKIAAELFVSPSTVKTHFEHIYEKLGVADRAAAVAHALRVGLIR
jgi:DNA-binding CsgD family transcriptional regulator